MARRGRRDLVALHWWLCWCYAVAPVAVAVDVVSASNSRRVVIVVSGGLLRAIVNRCTCGWLLCGSLCHLCGKLLCGSLCRC